MNLHALPILAKIDDFLFFIVIAVFGLIRFVSARMRKPDADEAPQISQEEQARRTRELQDEIRRRLAERNALAGGQPQVLHPVPELQRREAPAANPYVKQTPVYQNRTAPSQVASNEATRTMDIMLRLAEAKKQEAESRARAVKVRAQYAKAQEAAAAAVPRARCDLSDAHGLLSAFRDNPAVLREAVIMAEIIGGPVSERHGNPCPGFGD